MIDIKRVLALDAIFQTELQFWPQSKTIWSKYDKVYATDGINTDRQINLHPVKCIPISLTTPYHKSQLITSLIFSLFSLRSLSSGSPPCVPIRFGIGTAGSNFFSLSSFLGLPYFLCLYFCFQFLSWLFNFSFASSRAFSWSTRILFLKRSSSSL